MDEHVVVATRRSLHAVAERLLAGPQYREHGHDPAAGDAGRVRAGRGAAAGRGRPSWSGRAGGCRCAARSPTSAAALGVEAGAPADLYSEHAELGAGRRAGRRPGGGRAAARLVRPRRPGAARVRPGRGAGAVAGALRPGHRASTRSTTAISPGDGGHPRPYAYVGPWTPREGEFWNARLRVALRRRPAARHRGGGRLLRGGPGRREGSGDLTVTTAAGHNDRAPDGQRAGERRRARQLGAHDLARSRSPRRGGCPASGGCSRSHDQPVEPVHPVLHARHPRVVGAHVLDEQQPAARPQHPAQLARARGWSSTVHSVSVDRPRRSRRRRRAGPRRARGARGGRRDLLDARAGGA